MNACRLSPSQHARTHAHHMFKRIPPGWVCRCQAPPRNAYGNKCPPASPRHATQTPRPINLGNEGGWGKVGLQEWWEGGGRGVAAVVTRHAVVNVQQPVNTVTIPPKRALRHQRRLRHATPCLRTSHVQRASQPWQHQQPEGSTVRSPAANHTNIVTPPFKCAWSPHSGRRAVSGENGLANKKVGGVGWWEGWEH